MRKLMESMYPQTVLKPADEQTIQAIVANLAAKLPFTTDRRLQKAFYLAEVWSIEERLSRMSLVDFVSWTYGPWSLQIRVVEEKLQDEGVLGIVEKIPKKYEGAEFLQVINARSIPSMKSSEREFLNSFIDQVRYIDSEELTKMAKSTRPFKATKPHEIIGLDRYLAEMQEKHKRFQNSEKVAKLIFDAKAEAES